MRDIDYKKEFKDLYSAPKQNPVIVTVPNMNFLMIDGYGNPNTSAAFQGGIDALFSVSYTLKFMVKKSTQAINYAVMPLEGLWWSEDMSDFITGKASSWQWTIMIRQPEFILPEMISDAIDEVQKKKHLPALELVRCASYEEGLSAQILHIGPFSQERATIEKLHHFIEDLGYTCKDRHHELYLSDTRRAAPDKWKTIIRQPIQKN